MASGLPISISFALFGRSTLRPSLLTCMAAHQLFGLSCLWLELGQMQRVMTSQLWLYLFITSDAYFMY